MAINSPSVTTTSIDNATSACIRMLNVVPTPLVLLEDSVTPNELVGYYNYATGYVQLYMSSNAGNYYFRIG